MPILSKSLIFPILWLLSILFPHPAHASPQPVLLEIAPRRARILPHKANAHAWDLGFGESALPDVFVVIEANNQRLETKVQRNTLRPHWQQKQIFALLKHHTLRIALYDKDVHRIELIGQIDIPVSQLQKRNLLRFGQVIEFILDARPALPTHATPTPPRPREHPHPFHSSPIARPPSVSPIPPTARTLPHTPIPPHTPPLSRPPTSSTTPSLPTNT
ncbi:C2 domain-containing protein, partial [Myxococcota bacterium]|nr:C2 domain-containing protein [Myxococcota bacterium]